MVKTRNNDHSNIARDKFRLATEDIFGKTLTKRVVTRTLNDFGEVTGTSNSDTSFKAVFQVGTDVDEKLIEIGFVELGDAVLYVPDNALTTPLAVQDVVIKGTSGTCESWEVVTSKDPETDSVIFYTYGLKRRNDVTL